MTQYDPAQYGNYAESLPASFSPLNSGWADINAMNVENQRVDEIKSGQLMQNLSEISGVAKRLTEKYMKAERAKENAKLDSIYLEQYSSVASPVPGDNTTQTPGSVTNLPANLQEDIKEHDTKMAEEKDRQVDANAVAAKIEREDPNNFLLSEEFKKLSPYGQIQAQHRHLELTAAQFAPHLDSMISKVPELSSLDAATRNGAVTRIRQAFLENTLYAEGMPKFSMVAKAKYLFPTMHKVQQASNKLWHTNTKATLKGMELEEHKKNILSAAKSETPFQSLLDQADLQKHLHAGNRTAARDHVFKTEVVGMILSGQIQGKDAISKITEDLITAKGHKEKQSLDKLFPGLSNEIWKAHYKYEKEQYQQRELDTKLKKENWRKEYFKNILTKTPPEEQTVDFFNNLQAEYFEEFGEEATFIKDYSKRNSVTAVNASQQRDMFTKAKNTYTLRTADLLKSWVEPSVAKEFMEEAERQDKLRKDGTAYRALAMQKAEANASDIIVNEMDTSVTDMGERLYQMTLERANRLAINDKEIKGDEDYFADAWEATEKWFNNNRDNLIDGNGYKKEHKSYTKFARGTREYNNNLRKLKGVMGSLTKEQAIGLPMKVKEGEEPRTAFFPKSELEAMTVDYGDPRWVANPKLQYLADQYNMIVPEFLNHQRKAVGLPELGLNQTEIKANVLSGRDREALRRIRGKDLSKGQARLLTTKKELQSDGSFKEYIVMSNLGPQVTEASKKSGESGAKINSIMELMVNPKVFAGYDSFEDYMGSRDFTMDYNIGICKSTNDPNEKQEALDNLCRFDPSEYHLRFSTSK